MSDTLPALNPDDPTGQPIQVRLPDASEIVALVCPDCDGVVGGGLREAAYFSHAVRYPCPFCGKGPPQVTENVR
jgi:predicted RNA-binding Zn-ribbon protein involved in translation (DUF1610 family)